MTEVNLKKLAKFLVKAKKSTYANESAVEVFPERPLHKELEYAADGFYYRDSYIGFFQAPGMEEVRIENKNGPTIWTMAYSGGMFPKYHNDISFAKDIFRFLKKALSLVTEDMPFRGPEIYEERDLVYENIVLGGIGRFRGHESIFIPSTCEELFNQDYIGGLVIGK